MADPVDILDESEALAAINSTDPGDHTGEVAQMVTAVSQVIDAMCGPVVARTVTEVHDGSRATIWPRQAPVLSITSVTEFDGTTQTVLTDESVFGTVGGSSGFILSADGYRIERRSGGSAYRFASQVQVVYQAGRYASTTAVDARWKQAAGAIMARLWKRDGSGWAYSPDFYANADESTISSSSMFFRAIAPMVDEFLADQKLPPAVA